MKKIRVELISESQSKGRGVGFYGESLRDSLQQMSEVDLVENNPDIVHYMYFKLFQPDLPVFYSQKVVITIHDLTPLILPDHYPVGLRGKLSLEYQKSRANAASAIVTDSNNSKQDIHKLFGVDSHKIFVTPLASRELFYKQPSNQELKKTKIKFDLPSKFVLTVAGGPNPNKNLVRLAQACHRLSLPLVIAGKGVGLDPKEVNPHPELNDFFELVKMKNVIRVGFVSDEELLCFYKLANIYCQASLYEGFGLPLLEAMAAQTFVVSSNTSSLPEIYDRATPSFDPYSVDQIAMTIDEAIKISETKKADIVRKNFKRAKEFSFGQMAEATLSAYKYCLLK